MVHKCEPWFRRPKSHGLWFMLLHSLVHHELVHDHYLEDSSIPRCPDDAALLEAIQVAVEGLLVAERHPGRWLVAHHLRLDHRGLGGQGRHPAGEAAQLPVDELVTSGQGTETENGW